ncbi:MAG: RNA polymerase sigma factor [Burkholderiales bacterium]
MLIVWSANAITNTPHRAEQGDAKPEPMDRTSREIAEILGVSLDTVKVRLHRAREKLKQDLAVGCIFHRDELDEFACDRKPSTLPSTS